MLPSGRAYSCKSFSILSPKDINAASPAPPPLKANPGAIPFPEAIKRAPVIDKADGAKDDALEAISSAYSFMFPAYVASAER